MARRIPVVLAIQVGSAGPAADLVGELAGALMTLPAVTSASRALSLSSGTTAPIFLCSKESPESLS